MPVLRRLAWDKGLRESELLRALRVIEVRIVANLEDLVVRVWCIRESDPKVLLCECLGHPTCGPYDMSDGCS